MDYYETLGVGRSASSDEIKRAYRKLASQHHPDKGGDKNKFQEIEQAYRTLGDDQKRAEYDNPQPQFGGFGGGHPFGDIFGGGHPFGDIFGFRQARPQTNRSLQLQTSITLEEAFYGKELLATVRLPSGREQTVNIKIPPGIHEGTTLRLTGMGDDSIPQLPRGDILLSVHIINHAVFKRQGDELLVEHAISCVDAMVGLTMVVTGIDGKQLETTIPAGIQNDALIGLTGHGMPNFNDPSRRGRLLVKIKTYIPTLSEEQKDNLRKLNIV
jgi:DnaJ-class molecular chaperone